MTEVGGMTYRDAKAIVKAVRDEAYPDTDDYPCKSTFTLDPYLKRGLLDRVEAILEAGSFCIKTCNPNHRVMTRVEEVAHKARYAQASAEAAAEIAEVEAKYPGPGAASAASKGLVDPQAFARLQAKSELQDEVIAELRQEVATVSALGPHIRELLDRLTSTSGLRPVAERAGPPVTGRNQ